MPTPRPQHLDAPSDPKPKWKPRSRGWLHWVSLGFACAIVGVVIIVTPRQARAFERQWHLGGGVGVVVPSSTYGAGAAFSLHAAYGISDVFDARFTLSSSLHDVKVNGPDRNSLSQGTLGLAYKLDIIEWVPYFGVRAGFYQFGAAPLGVFARRGGALGWMAGFDYAFSRSAALGAEVSYDLLLPEGGALGVFLHAEYRWGY